MSVQFVEIGGQKMAIMPVAEYQHLLAEAEEADDVRAAEGAERRRLEGEEYLPMDLVDRILDGESALRVWRRYRGYTLLTLSEKADIGQSYLSELENGNRQGKPAIGRKLAQALDVMVDDILPDPES